MIAALIPLLGGLLEKLIPDPTAQAQAKLALMNMVQTGELAKITAASDVIKAEASSQFRITATWRPILMLAITAILVNNYLVAPYLHAMFGWQVVLDFPQALWDLLKLGVGGYVVGRSVEKSVAVWKGKPVGMPTAPSTPTDNFTKGA